MRKKKIVLIDEPFDEEERALMEAVETSEPKLLPPEEIEAIKNSISTKCVCIRIQESDVEGFKQKALKAGIPYQTLINSVLHRYLTGDLVPKESL